MPNVTLDDLSHHATGRARRAYLGVLWAGVNKLLPAISGLIVFLVVSRVISPADFGLVAFAVAIVGAIGAMSPLGFGDALVQRHDLTNAHLNATFWLCLIWGAALYGVTAFVVAPLSGLVGDHMLAALLPVVGLRLIFDLGSVVPTSLLSRRMHFRQIAVRTLVSSVASLIVCLLVLWLGYGLWALVISQLIGAAVSCAVSWVSVAWRPHRGMDQGALRQLVNFGTFSSGSRLLSTINVDQLLVGSLLGATALGLFSFARRIFALMNDVLTGALSAVSDPLLSSMQTEPDKLRQTYLATTFLSSVLAFPIFIGVALVADQLIPLVFGDHWTAAIVPLQAFCAIGILSCIGILQSSLIRAKGRAAWWMWYQTVQQFLTAATVLALFPMGINAVAIGITVKTWLVWSVGVREVGRLIELPLHKYVLSFLPPLAACGVMSVIVMAIRLSFGSPTLITLAAQIAAGLVAYLLALATLSGNRLKEIRAMLRARS